MSFSADAPAADVLKFYSDNLFQNQWVLDPSKKVGISTESVSRSDAFSQTEAYVWRDKTNRVPWTLALTLSVQETALTSPKRSKVIVVLNRIPSLTNLPPYPDAEQVLYVTKPPTTQQEIGDRRTTYVTSASPEQVLAFYQNVLPQCGWQADPASVRSANVLHYKWSVESMHFTSPDIVGEAGYFLAVKAETAVGADGNTGTTSVTVDVNALYAGRLDGYDLGDSTP